MRPQTVGLFIAAASFDLRAAAVFNFNCKWEACRAINLSPSEIPDLLCIAVFEELAEIARAL